MSGIGEAIPGAALSAFFDALFEKLRSSELLNFVTEAQVRGEIKEWEKKLRKLRLVLEDAEEKQIENRLVKEWLGELKHLAYDVEDILDEFSTECLRRRVMGEPQAASTSKIRKLIPACCSTFSPRAVMFNSEMMSRIGEITIRLKGIVEDMKDFNLVAKTSSKVGQRLLSTSLHDEAQVYGRDGDKDKILELLFKHEGEDARVGVIPIVGMGGMGKTTLAKLVYNDNSIPYHFQVKAWVCVSDVFDILRVTKGILKSITSQSFDLKELNQVQLQLKEKLAGKKFLLVLDDVWTEDYNDWHALRTLLMDGAPGSKILVTTRSTNVAEMMGTIAYHDLKRISDDDCWFLFAKHAFENRSIAAKSELENIGREIVKRRCGGLPLAARTLGGLLRSRQRENEWEEVLNNKLWSVLDASNNIIPALELSYYYLPSHLKRCFAYCAILPKDYEFEQREIILLWMAEGLIPQRKEDLGSDYFCDLLSRSFFQAPNTDEDRFIMHDLVNDLAQKVAEDICVRLQEEVNAGEESKKERARHISYMQGVDGIKRFAPFRTMKCLRTFLPLSLRSNYSCYLPKSVPGELLSNLRFLRVLSFSRYNIRELPNSIGDLKHLRYLDLSYTQIEVLPESTTSLYNLQTLILKECQGIKKLPTGMDNLVNLYYLDIRGAYLIEGMPLDIKELSGLQILSNFDISRGRFTITTLMNLKSLQGEVCISNLDYLASASDARKARLMDKKGIHVLELTWSNGSDISAARDFNRLWPYERCPVSDEEDDQRVQYYVEDEGGQYHVLDGLQPHKNLKKLIISNYAQTRFPSWIGDPVFNNIVHLRLEGCKTCKSLPQLGMLPSLKELLIIGMSSLQRVEQEFYGNNCYNPFPSLEVLRFEDMYVWEEWNACEFGFLVLRELFIEACAKLSGKLPIHLPSLEKLVIRSCENFVASLSSLPMLSALEINNCREVDFKFYVNFSSLNMIVLSRISTITNMADGFLQRLKNFKKLTVSSSFFYVASTVTVPSTLSRFVVISTSECVIEKCPQLVSKMLDEAEQFQMRLAGSELESLTLRRCEKLPAWMIFLKELKLSNCHFLVSLGRSYFPPTLKKLRIEDCKNLKGLLEEDESETSSSSTNLEDLYIFGCDNLTSISPGRQLPSSLQHLSCHYCSNLTSITPQGKLPSRLQSLHISDCEELESLAERFDDNTSLQTFNITDCSSLKSFPDGLHNLINLCEFTISNCPCIVSFPQGGLPTTSLRKLAIGSLENLEALPDNMHKLSSLQEFEICGCSSLMSFPSPGLPSNLTALEILDLKNCKPLFEWGLDRLNSLQKLSISRVCPEVMSFPPDDPEVTLPPSLTHLDIIGFPNLEYLSTRGFQNLTSLQYLHTENCPKLDSFPKHGLPDSLLELYVNDCPKLASFPENGLPDSLLELYVRYCPVLKQRCLEGKGPEWSKIANIPYVRI